MAEDIFEKAVWKQFPQDDGISLVYVSADSQSDTGQKLTADPLTALIESGINTGVDQGWRVQLHVANAEIPSGPLPLSEQITATNPFVIRGKKAAYVLIYSLQLAVVVVARVDAQGEQLDRATVLNTLKESTSKFLAAQPES